MNGLDDGFSKGDEDEEDEEHDRCGKVGEVESRAVVEELVSVQIVLGDPLVLD